MTNVFSCWQSAWSLQGCLQRVLQTAGLAKDTVELLLMLSVGYYNLLSLWYESLYLAEGCPRVAPDGFIIH